MLVLLILFILWPFAELTLLVRLGHATGAMTAIGVVVLTGVLGAALARREGLKVWYRIRQELAAGHMPGDQLLDAVLILVAGVLLILPGLITDVIGILLLIPPVRAFVGRRLRSKFRTRFTIMHVGTPQPNPDDGFIDVEAHEVGRTPLGNDHHETQ
jgi:UPF0716 protein FxsA